VTAEILTDVQAALWGKLVFIASLGGVGAVTRATAGVLRALPETRRMLESAIREIVAVAAAHGVSLPQDTLPRTLAFIDGLPPDTTTSMQRDILEGRPSELSYQNGAVSRLGAARGAPAPTHEFIYASLLPQENQARGLADS
jgi:2-dehydropantoate 2-reductase